MMFLFKSNGHFFASAVHDLRVGLAFLQNHQGQIDKSIDMATTVVSTVDPALAPLAMEIDRASEAALGEALAIASKMSGAEASKGMSVTYDLAAITEFRALLATMEVLKPGSTVPQANLIGE